MMTMTWRGDKSRCENGFGPDREHTEHAFGFFDSTSLRRSLVISALTWMSIPTVGVFISPRLVCQYPRALCCYKGVSGDMRHQKVK